MFSQALKVLPLLALLVSTSTGQCDNVIDRDVAIIGGGSSGTYAAVRLRDQGKSVVLIEKNDVLGGHTNTYRDPQSHQTVDYGVVVFHDLPVVENYFNRLNVSWTVGSPDFGSSAPKWLDPETAKIVRYMVPNATNALVAYAEQLSKYPDLDHGFFLPDPVPEDLLLPFEKFLLKYPNVANATYPAFTYGQGLGDFLKQPTLYVFKVFGLNLVQTLSTGFLVTTSNNNYEIYENAGQLLGSDVLLNSYVTSTPHRDSDGVELKIEMPSGSQTVRVNKLLITIPQQLDILSPFALDDPESSIFGMFTNTGYYTSLVNNTGLPANFSSSSVSANTTQNIPKLPGVYSVSNTAIPGIFDIKYGSPGSLPDEYVRGEIIAYVKKLQANGFAQQGLGEPNFVRFKSHTPFELTVSPQQIANGFYKKLYNLQGYRNTWYAGGALQCPDSSLIWNFTESYVLPGLLE